MNPQDNSTMSTSDNNNNSGDHPNDWEKFWSRSQECWCWESRSRKVSYVAAFPCQQAVFNAGWVKVPEERKQYLNVFTGRKVYHRSMIPEFDDSKADNTVNNNKKDNNNTKKRPPDANQTDQLQAAQHYDKEAQKSMKRSRQDRNKGSVAKMRAFNNWVKSVLIDGPLQALNRYHPRTVHVLELACGKGGDYFKIQNACPRGCHLNYVGVDIAKVGLEEFVRRLSENRRRSEGARTADQRLAAVNLGTDRLTKDEVPVWSSRNRAAREDWEQAPAFFRDERFDLVSMQFALHYMFESPQRLQDFFESWAGHLMEGCFFSVTTMDAQVVRRYLQDNKDKDSNDVVLRDEQGRPTCTMAFDEETRKQFLKPDWSRQSLGMRYQFTLTEYDQAGEASNLVEAPEWIVSLDLLCEYAHKYGSLSLVRQESMNFHDFYHEHKNVPHYRQLLQRMKVVPREGDSFSELEWKLAGLYRTAVFRKESSRDYGDRRPR